jgi:hypothetical protein
MVCAWFRSERPRSQPRGPCSGTRRRPDSPHAGQAAPLPAALVEDNGACFIVRDANGQALSYDVYYENESGRRTAAAAMKSPTRPAWALVPLAGVDHRPGHQRPGPI